MAKVIRLILLFILFLTSQSGIAATTEFTVHQYDVNHIAQSDEIYGYDTNINLRHCCHILLTANTQDWSFLAFVSDFLVPKSVGNGADNIANASRLAKQLRLQSARSPFTAEGKLTSEALKNSRRIIKSSELNNPAIPKGFNKYSTETFQSPSGNFQTHFYRNPQTGEVLYGLDYKAVFNAASGK